VYSLTDSTPEEVRHFVIAADAGRKKAVPDAKRVCRRRMVHHDIATHIRISRTVIGIQ
jgi:hypothetical protein